MVASGYLLLSLLVAGLYVLDPQGIARVDGTATSFGDLFLQPPYLGLDRLGGIVSDKPLQHLLITAESLLGLFVTALVTGLVFSRFSLPRLGSCSLRRPRGPHLQRLAHVDVPVGQ